MQTTLFTTEQNIEAAIAATKTIQDYEYGSDKHLAMLAQCGFNSTDEYQAAFEAQPCYIAYEKFNLAFKLSKGAERKLMIAAMNHAGLWREDVGHESGIELFELSKQYLPKESQLVELMIQLDLKAPWDWTM